MGRRPLLINHDYPYHVTSRSNNKEWFYLPLPDAWEIFCEKLADTSALYRVFVHAFVLMSNHFHLVLTTSGTPLGEVMRHFTTEVSRVIQRRANRINHIFGARYKWSLLDTSYGTAYGYKYALRNPVRAGLCEKCEDYPYSSFGVNPPNLLVPTVDGIESHWSLVPKNWDARSDWLNQPTRKEWDDLIGKGLRRERFAFSKGREVQKTLRELKASYGVETEWELDPEKGTDTFSIL